MGGNFPPSSPPALPIVGACLVLCVSPTGLCAVFISLSPLWGYVRGKSVGSWLSFLVLRLSVLKSVYLVFSVVYGYGRFFLASQVLSAERSSLKAPFLARVSPFPTDGAEHLVFIYLKSCLLQRCVSSDRAALPLHVSLDHPVQIDDPCCQEKARDRPEEEASSKR